MIDEKTIHEVMARYEIGCCPDHPSKDLHNYRMWGKSDLVIYPKPNSDGVKMDGCSFQNIETVAELETILKCLGIPKKPETIESELKRWFLDQSIKDDFLELHNKYLNKSMDEIENLFRKYLTEDSNYMIVFNKIKELRRN